MGGFGHGDAAGVMKDGDTGERLGVCTLLCELEHALTPERELRECNDMILECTATRQAAAFIRSSASSGVQHVSTLLQQAAVCNRRRGCHGAIECQ